MNCADDLVKFLSKWVLEHCLDDMKFVQKRIDKTSIHRLESVISCSFEKVSYTAAIEILEKVKSRLSTLLSCDSVFHFYPCPSEY